ncbi:MAG: ABC transporter permease subunit [Candidatus Saccharimonadales bacterium]
MMQSVFLRTLYDKRWFALGWSLALSLMAILMIAMFPSLHEGMKNIAATMPPQLQGLVGDISLFGHIDTYLSSQLYDIRIPLFLMIMAVVLAQGLSVGAEERGEMRTILSTATSRTRYYVQTFLAACVIFAVALSVTSLVTWVAVPMVSQTIATSLVIKLGGLSLLFALVIFAICYGVGMMTGSRMLVMSVGVGLIVSSVILEAGRTVDWLELAQKISMLHYYDAGKLLTTGLDFKHLLVQLVLLIVSLVAGWLVYRRRDIA